VTLCEIATDERSRADLLRRARTALKDVRRFARVIPVGRPRALLWRGSVASLAGNSTEARHRWAHTIALAERMGMPYEAAMARFSIGRDLGAGDPEGRRMLEIAYEALSTLGAVFDATRVRDSLAAVSSQSAG